MKFFIIFGESLQLARKVFPELSETFKRTELFFSSHGAVNGVDAW